MILATSFLIKVLLALASGLGVFWTIKKHCAKRYAAVILACVTVLVSACAGMLASKAVPPLTDVVTITATDERNPAASGTVISVRGYTVDDVDYPADSPVSGKWFWSDESLMWRSEEIANRPDGLTREIQVTVPVGWNRAINFPAGEWRGIVAVEYGDEQQTVDLYAEKSGVKQVYIAKSTSIRLILNQVRYLAVYAVVLLALAGAITFAVCQWLRDSGKVKAWLDRRFWIAYLLIALVSFFYMVRYSAEEGFWSAELHAIRSMNLGRNILNTLLVSHTSYYPSLFTSTIGQAWYHIAPFGETYLLLPYELATACGGIFVALAGEKLANRRTGVACSLFSAFAYTLIYECGYEIRTYGFLYLCAAILFYLFVLKSAARLESGKPVLKYEILFALFVFLSASNHVFGVFLSCLLFCADAVLFLRKQSKWTFAIPYVSGAILFIPWIYNIFASKIISSSQSWQPAPTLSGVVDLIKFLSGKNTLALVLLAFGAIFVIVCTFRAPSEFSLTRFMSLTCIWLIASLIGFMFCYGKFINPNATMWIKRYFIVLFPAVAVLCGIAADELLSLFSQKNVRATVSLLLAGYFIASSCGALIADVKVERQAYRASAEWFHDNELYRKDAVIVFAGFFSDMRGWENYYLRQQGQRDSLDVISQDGISSEDLAEYKTIYLQYEYRALNSNMKKILEEEFEMTAQYEDVKIRTYVRKSAE